MFPARPSACCQDCAGRLLSSTRVWRKRLPLSAWPRSLSQKLGNAGSQSLQPFTLLLFSKLSRCPLYLLLVWRLSPVPVVLWNPQVMWISPCGLSARRRQRSKVLPLPFRRLCHKQIFSLLRNLLQGVLYQLFRCFFGKPPP